MTGFSVIVAVLIFISIIIMSNKFFYTMELKAVRRKCMRSFGLDILQSEYSFEQIVYFVSLPSNIPCIRNAKKENLVIKLDYGSLFFPQLLGIKIVIKTNVEDIILAYLPIKDFRLRALDQFLQQGRIDDKQYLKLSASKLIHQVTLSEISDEVCKQIHVGRKAKIVS